ncbi:MAG TPA: MBL fold metallo-hydrolase [Candidatus Pullichristensenella stercoripullorum]|nr:MBL fold metallo-hydrolase [Candidatus Pullichristensenella stercoripullorum]
MYLTILGNNGPFPAPGGACSSYLLESDSGETKLLIDAGTGSLARLMDIARPETLDAVVLSHLHFDHMSDLLPMQYALQFSARERPLPLFLPRRPERVRALLECPYYDLFDHEDIAVGEMRLRFIPAVHPVEGSCVAVEGDGAKFVFTGDTNLDPALELFADGCDLLLADAGLSRADWTEKKPHLSASHCGALARDVRAGALLLTHLNPLYDPQALLDEARRDYPAAELARLGERYRV